MGRIQILPSQLVNKIAAGEVIERPASVVKELLENAIDAGANRIDVTVDDGGKQLIQVTDDGCGMSSEDLVLAWTAHATSKLNTVEDLFVISTMGFRGEALASVASVSRGRIVSRTVDGQGGYEITVEGGQTNQPKPTAAPVGTTVQVRDLFFNMPVRRKFLKSAGTEIAHITDHLGRVALAYPQVHFTLTHNGRKSLELPSVVASRDRIGALFDPELAQTLIETHSDERGVRIQAFLGRPDASRTSAKWQYFFLNRRYIRDRLVQHAVREAYRGLIEPSRYPVAFIFLQMDPQLVDVNVHPTKIEVRFRDANTVYSQVQAAIREKFLTSDLSARMPLGANDHLQEQAPTADRIRRAMADFIKSSPPGWTNLDFGFGSRSIAKAVQKQRPFSSTDLRTELDRLFESDNPSGQKAETAGHVRVSRADAFVPVLQIHKSYLVSETEDGLVIIDQHALHERIIHERLSQAVLNRQVPSQRLLMPLPVQLNNQQKALLDQVKEILYRVGIELADFGPGSVAVQSFPAMLDKADPAAVVQDIVDRLADLPGDSAAQQILEEVIASLACKAAVKAGDNLSQEEIAQLLADGKHAQQASSCPHGRPTTLKLTLAELERQFRRT